MPIAILATLEGSRSALCLPEPEDIQQRRKEENEQGIERLKPGGRNLEVHDFRPGRILVGPGLHRIALLLVDRPKNDVQQAEEDQGQDAPPFRSIERPLPLGFRKRLGRGDIVRREKPLAEEINDQTEHHADAGGAESPMPAEPVAASVPQTRLQMNAPRLMPM